MGKAWITMDFKYGGGLLLTLTKHLLAYLDYTYKSVHIAQIYQYINIPKIGNLYIFVFRYI